MDPNRQENLKHVCLQHKILNFDANLFLTQFFKKDSQYFNCLKEKISNQPTFYSKRNKFT